MSGNFTGRRRRGGDTADTEDVAGRIADAEARAITALPVDELPIETTTADKGYHSAAEIEQLKGSGIAANIPDRVHNRNPANLSGEARAAVQRCACFVKSTAGKDLLRKRGRHIERSFALFPRLRRDATSDAARKGKHRKRYSIAATGYDVSLIMLTLLPGRRNSTRQEPENAFCCLYSRDLCFSQDSLPGSSSERGFTLPR